MSGWEGGQEDYSMLRGHLRRWDRVFPDGSKGIIVYFEKHSGGEGYEWRYLFGTLGEDDGASVTLTGAKRAVESRYRLHAGPKKARNMHAYYKRKYGDHPPPRHFGESLDHYRARTGYDRWW